MAGRPKEEWHEKGGEPRERIDQFIDERWVTSYKVTSRKHTVSYWLL